MAISNNPQWAALTYPPEAATNTYRHNGVATATWKSGHQDKEWLDTAKRVEPKCDMDEWPPANLLNDADPAITRGGEDSSGQVIQFLPATQNRGASSMWRATCFSKIVRDMSPRWKRCKSIEKKGRG